MTETAVLYVAGRDPGDDLDDALGASASVVRAVTATDALKRLGDEAVGCVVVRTPLEDMAVDEFLSMVRDSHAGLPAVVVGEDDLSPAVGRALAKDATDYRHADEGPGAVVAAVDRLVSRRRATEALSEHDRLRRLQREVTRAVVEASTRAEVEQRVYERLAATGRYRFVWIGDYDTGANEMLLHVPFDGRFDPTELGSLVDGGEPTFVADAVDSGEVTVARGTVRTRGASATAPSGPGGPTSAANDSMPAEDLATAAIPLVHAGRTLGVILLSTDRPAAFEEAERSVLGEIAAVIAHGLWALDDREVPEAETEEDGDDLGEFAGLLAHELRNPIGIAVTHLEIARESGGDDAFDRVEEALESAQETIDSVLSVVGRTGIGERRRRSLADDAREAWSAIDAAEAELVVLNSAPLEADHDLVVRLFTNLFRNAVAHGGDDVTVRVGTLADGFFVEDDGPGIPPEERDAVFEWGHSTTDEGVGLGLSIVREIVDAHGWSIAVAEADSGGARFEITGAGE